MWMTGDHRQANLINITQIAGVMLEMLCGVSEIERRGETLNFVYNLVALVMKMGHGTWCKINAFQLI
jgi:hypothetical protein